jgi:hypothetical protein
MAFRAQRSLNPSATILGQLLKSNYLSEDFPAIVTTSGFAQFCTDHHDRLESLENLLSAPGEAGAFQPVKVRRG